MNTNIESLYDYVLQQMAAESYFEGVASTDLLAIRRALTLGTNRDDYQNGPPDLNEGWPGYTRMTEAQADEFLAKFQLVHQWSDNPTPKGDRPAAEGRADRPQLNDEILANTGLSATLIRKKDSSGNVTNDYTLAIRSTEFRSWEKGGDGERDTFPTDIHGVALNGFALAQLNALERYYQWLKDNGHLPAGARLDVTGYSLGGHLATVFTEIHQDDADIRFGQTVCFNAPGRGTYDASVGSLKSLIDYFDATLTNPDFDAALAAGWGAGNETYAAAKQRVGQPFDLKYLYDDPRYLWAKGLAEKKFGIGNIRLFFLNQLGNPDQGTVNTTTMARITHAFGFETILNTNMTANSGMHGRVVRIGIESQPLLEGGGGFLGDWLGGDFGNGHSISLLSDSLALQRALHAMDPAFTLETFIPILQSASHRKTVNGPNANYEVDALERILDGLRRLLTGPSAIPTPYKEGAGGFGDWTSRQQFQNNVKALTDSSAFQQLAGKLTLASAAGADLATRARTDFGALLALATLSPVVLMPKTLADAPAVEAALATQWGDTHAQWLADKQAHAQGTAHSTLTFTDTWLADRQALLQWQMVRNVRNISSDTITGALAGRTITEAINYQDNASGTQLFVGVADRPSFRVQVVFGGPGDDAISGYGRNDRLYAGAGDDILHGLGGADWLEGNAGDDTLDGGAGHDTLLGGAGHDTYRFSGAWGADTVVDAGGAGRLWVEGLGTLSGAGSQPLAADVWRSADARVYFTRVAGAGTGAGATDTTLYVSFADRPDTIRVLGWSDGALGLSLGSQPYVPATSASYSGEHAKPTTPDGLNYLLGADGNYAIGEALPGAPDVLNGSDAADALRGLGGNDGLAGGAGDDLVDGGAGADLLLGGAGTDTLLGGEGDDFIFGSVAGRIDTPTRSDFSTPAASGSELARGFSWVAYRPAGSDTVLIGGAGSIAPLAGDAGNFIDAGAGDDFVGAGSGADVVHGGDGHDRIAGLAGGDVLHGDAGADQLWGDGVASGSSGWYTAADAHGDDLLVGGSGNDELVGQGGADSLHGGDDDDLLLGDDSDAARTALAAHGDDWLDGGAGNDHLVGHGGADRLFGGSGADALFGDAGLATTPAGAHGDDTLDGGDGDDYLEGGGGRDALSGGAGADTLWGDSSQPGLQGAQYGADTLDGGAGDDSLIGGGAADVLAGGDGDDWLYGDTSDVPDVAEADQGADTLDGGAGHDHLYGHGGADWLLGGAGTDVLDGGAGDDVVEGGGDADALFGGAGDDEYRIARGQGGAGDYRDTIQDTEGRDTVVLEGVTLAELAVHLHPDGMLELAWAPGDGVLIVDGVTSSVATVVASGESIALATLVGQRLAGNVQAASARDAGVVIGGANSDVLSVSHAGNVVNGGRGDDTIQLGSSAGATVAMSAGDGLDQLSAVRRSTSATPAARNVLQLGPGATADGLRLYKTGPAQYVLVFNDAGDGVRFSAGTAGSTTVDPADWPLDTVAFADGTTLTWQQVLDRGVAPAAPVATEGHDTLTLTPIGDTLFALGGNDTIDGLGGHDVLYGEAGDDVLIGGAGNDVLHGGSGRNRLVGGDGNDSLVGGNASAHDISEGGEGDDSYWFSHGYGIDVGGLAEDTSATSNDTYVVRSSGGAGTLTPQTWTVRDQGGADQLRIDVFGLLPEFTTARRDGSTLVLANRNLSVAIEGMLKDDGTLDLARAIESVRFADGTQYTAAQLLAMTLQGSARDDLIRGYRVGDMIDAGDGHDQVYGDAGDDTLDGGSGNDALFGDDGNDLLRGGDGSDTLDGGAGADRLDGGAGSDVLHGGAGDDRLDAGAGGGVLYGGDGNDEYTAQSGHGDVRVGWSRNAYDGGTDRLVLDALPAAVRATVESSAIGGDEDDLVIRWNDGSTTVRLLLQGDATGPAGGVESIVHADGTALSWSAIASAATPVASAGDDTLRFSSLDDVASGGDGNDLLQGRAGNDRLDGGAGDDTLDGGSGADVLTGGAGQDVYVATDAIDTVRYAPGDGDDTLAGRAVVEFAAGVSPADVRLVREGADSVSVRVGAAGSIVTTGVYRTDSLISGVRFADGTQWSRDDVLARLFAGTGGDDMIHGFTDDDRIAGDGGHDTLFGSAGHDELDGGSGHDTLDGGEGRDVLRGGIGNDVLYAGAGSDVLIGGEGDDTLDAMSRSSPIGSYTADDEHTLDGGAGSDVLLASNTGTTTYRFDAGFGQDRIAASAGRQPSLTGTVNFGSGIAARDVRVSKSWNSLILSFASAPDTVLVEGFFASGGPTPSDRTPVTRVQFADGTVWTAADLAARVAPALTMTHDVYTGTAGDDTIDALAGNDFVYAGAGNDTVRGGDGNDSLEGEAGDDVLVGGSGADMLYGGAGNDRYEYASGDGNDIVYDSEGAADVLAFGAGIASSAVRIAFSDPTDPASGHVLTFSDRPDTVSLSGIDAISFDDGTIWNTAQIDRMARTIYGSASADSLVGTSGHDVLMGLAGTDTLTGNAGDDWLDGGAGADTLRGGSGHDTYVVDDAADAISELSGQGTDLVQASLSWTLGANLEHLTLTGSAALNGTGNTLANTLTGNDAANTLNGGSGNDTLIGNGGADWLDGGTGSDTLRGGAGDDTYVVNVATDVLSENANEGLDRVHSAVAWTLGAHLEHLTLTGTTAIAGTGNALDNQLSGNAAANTLTGQGGADRLDGGAGNDTLVGGTGGDTYVFGRGYGADTIQENDASSGSTDVLSFLSGITAEQIWLRRVSNHLEVGVIGTSDKMTISNWYLGSQYRVEQFRTADGKVLLDTQVQALVNAMAAFAPPAAGQTSLPPAYANTLLPVIAANWQ